MLEFSDAGPPLSALRGTTPPAGDIHLVMFDTHGHRPHFADAAAATLATRALREAAATSPTRLLAWVLMPDHWHALLQDSPREGLARAIARFKYAMARPVREADPGCERVWSTTWQQHELRSDEVIRGCARHLVFNPVRAGLVARPADYPFWDAVWFEGGSRHRGEASRPVGIPRVEIAEASPL